MDSFKSSKLGSGNPGISAAWYSRCPSRAGDWFDLPLPLLLSSEMQRHDSEQVRSQHLTQHLDPNGKLFDDAMAKMAREQWHVSYISYYKDICHQPPVVMTEGQWETTTGCPLFTSEGEPLMFDDHHFTISGSLLFANAVRKLGQLP